MHKLVSEKFLPFLNFTSYVTIFAFIFMMFFLIIDHIIVYKSILSEITIYKQDEIVYRENNQNSPLHVTWEIDRKKECKVIIRRIIHDVSNNVNIEVNSETRYIDQIEKVRTETKLNIPNYLIEGLYYYNSKLMYFCSISSYLFGPKVVYTPKVFFRIKSI